MNCPFLKEARVKYCDKSAFRKLIRIAGDVAQETCATPRHRECSIYQRFAADSERKGARISAPPLENQKRGIQAARGGPFCAVPEEQAQCPYLRESLVQYCATSASPRFIPYSEPLLSRCGNDSYRYCDGFLGTAVSQAEKQDYVVGGMRIPSWLYYSSNHLWLDAAKGGSCHLGVDAFFTRVLGTVERITFLRQTGVHRPSAVLTVRGIDVEVIFPNPVLLTSSNLYLRANPVKLTADPYGMGWLFQGIQLPGQPPVTSGLIRGEAVVPWIEREIGRMSNFLTECWNSRHGTRLMNDGGVFHEDMLQQLNREETLRLFHEFFWGLRV